MTESTEDQSEDAVCVRGVQQVSRAESRPVVVTMRERTVGLGGLRQVCREKDWPIDVILEDQKQITHAEEREKTCSYCFGKHPT